MRRDRFKSLGIERIECAPGVALAHIDAFIQTFVEQDSRERAALLLKREGWTPRVSTFLIQRIDKKLCTLRDDRSRPEQWPRQFLRQGIWIQGASVGIHMSLEQASAASLALCTDALFSIEAGRLAVFLNHEWGVWYCVAAGSMNS